VRRLALSGRGLANFRFTEFSEVRKKESKTSSFAGCVPFRQGVCCIRCVADGRRVKTQDRSLPLLLDQGQLPRHRSLALSYSLRSTRQEYGDGQEHSEEGYVGGRATVFLVGLTVIFAVVLGTTSYEARCAGFLLLRDVR